MTYRENVNLPAGQLAKVASNGDGFCTTALIHYHQPCAPLHLHMQHNTYAAAKKSTMMMVWTEQCMWPTQSVAMLKAQWPSSTIWHQTSIKLQWRQNSNMQLMLSLNMRPTLLVTTQSVMVQQQTVQVKTDSRCTAAHADDQCLRRPPNRLTAVEAVGRSQELLQRCTGDCTYLTLGKNTNEG